ncbi:tetratricopeptide repeat-containing sensor histidine kinase [Christiangramia sp. OXR-203]|uniref:tetratricopeptide repeat-containing sensor histidine kinase n=1 Tax=Christiangramia sp. OXR-203 TaxID=3100176 RepID=UPI002AC99A06|nr:tetratricopeptide repeat protein [Christiangramia sp. OXR-203]WPY99827.1 tetratricopeptide repeat protein [Christiangramia sp. OXR-203]
MQISKYFLSYLCLCLSLIACDQASENNSEEIKPGTGEYYFQQGLKAKDAPVMLKTFKEGLANGKFNNDTISLWLLDGIIYSNNRLKKYDSSMVYSDQMIEKARSTNNTHFEALGYYRKAIIHRSLNNYKEHFRNAFVSKELHLANGDSANAGERAIEMANAQSRLTDYTGAQETAAEALKLLDPIDSTYFSTAYNIIATAYRNQGFYKDAVIEWQNALRFAANVKDSLSNLNNIALSLQDQKNYNEAIAVFENILRRSESTNILSKARFLDNLAYTRWLQDSTTNVEDELLEARNIRLLNKGKNGLLASYDHLANYYRNSDEYISKLYADSLFLTARELNSKSAQLNAMEKLIQLSPMESVKELSTRYIELSDSIRTESIQAKNMFAKITFDEEQKELEIDQLQDQTALQAIEKEQLQDQIIILSLGSLLVLVSGGFGFYYLRQRHTRDKIREAHRTESRISKKIHDELANDVYNVMSGMDTIAPNTLMDKLENIYNRTRNISRENSSIPTGADYLPHLLSTLSSSLPADARLILRGENSINWKSLSPEKKIILYRVLQEIMINMNKHSKASLVAIVFSEENRTLHIQYSDNGIGTSRQSLQSGNGFLNMENRILSIKGKLNFETEQEKGLKVLIQIPI